MKQKRTITFKHFKDTARHSWSEYMRVDLTDYGQWEGFTQFLNYFWKQFDSRRKYKGEKIGAKSSSDKYIKVIKESKELGKVEEKKKYKKIFWKFYFKEQL